MGLLSSHFDKRMTIADLDDVMDYSVYGRPTITGANVSSQTALAIAAVYQAVGILARNVAQLPLHVYRYRADGGKEPADNHPMYRLLHDQPNPEQTSFEWRQTMMGHLALRGNAYAEKEQGTDGYLKALWILPPDRVRVMRDGQTLIYKVRLPGTSEEKTLPESRVLHLRGLSTDGVMGLSPLTVARETFGLAMAAQEYGSQFYRNDSRPGGVLQAPNKLSKIAYDRLKASWDQEHQGLSQAHRLAILEEGMSWHQVSLNPQDAQFIETRKFSVIEIARVFNVPPHFLCDLERATYSNIEQQSLEFVVYSLMPWLVSWEQRLHLSLLREEEQGALFCSFVVQGLLRGDMQARVQAYATARQWGWMNADEIRALENMNPIADGSGKDYWQPANFVDTTDPPTPQKTNGKGVGSAKNIPASTVTTKPSNGKRHDDTEPPVVIPATVR